MFHKLVLFLVIFGALNVGLVSLVQVDLITMIFGTFSLIINVLVGFSGLYMLLTTYTTLLKKTA